MNKISLKLGYWSALLCAATFIIWIISFAGIAIISPLYTWDGLSGYIDFINSNNQFFQYLAKSFLVVFSVSFIVLLISLGELIIPERKVLAKIGIVFGIMFSLLSAMHYFGQISSVRWALDKEQLTGIEHFLQANPTSFLASMNMLGWTLFLGLSSLFMAFALEKTGNFNLMKIALLVNGISCLLAGIGFITQTDIITFVFINLFMGAALLVFTITAARLFKLN